MKRLFDRLAYALSKAAHEKSQFNLELKFRTAQSKGSRETGSIKVQGRALPSRHHPIFAFQSCRDPVHGVDGSSVR